MLFDRLANEAALCHSGMTTNESLAGAGAGDGLPTTVLAKMGRRHQISKTRQPVIVVVWLCRPQETVFFARRIGLSFLSGFIKYTIS